MKHRDPNYTCTKTGTAMGKLTCRTRQAHFVRKLSNGANELWGEYGRIYDIRRLRQGFVRSTEQGWPNDPSILLTNRPSDDPESYMWVLTIPQAEFDGNVNMNAQDDQNPTGDK